MALAPIIPSTPGIEVLIKGVWRKLDIKESTPFMHPNNANLFVSYDPILESTCGDQDCRNCYPERQSWLNYLKAKDRTERSATYGLKDFAAQFVGVKEMSFGFRNEPNPPLKGTVMNQIIIDIDEKAHQKGKTIRVEEFGVKFPDGKISWGDYNAQLRNNINSDEGRLRARKVYKSIQEAAHAPLGELEFLKRTITTRYSEGDVVED